MAVWTVGPTLGTYLSHTTAYADALAAVDHGAEIRTVEDGVYSGQVLDMTGLTGVSFTKANGVDYTIGLDTAAPYAFTVGNGFAMTGGTIRAKSYRSMRINGAGKSASFIGTNFYIDAGEALSFAWADSGASLSITDAVVDGDTQSVIHFLAALGANAVTLSNVRFKDSVTYTDAAVLAGSTPTTSIDIAACGAEAGNLFVVSAGTTVTALSIEGSYAPNLVDNNGTITAFTGDFNAYNTTAAGTGNATFTDGGITNFGLDDRGYALKSSPLYRAVDAGLDFGSTHDAEGNPRNTGGRLDIGPLQNQHQAGLAIEVIA